MSLYILSTVGEEKEVDRGIGGGQQYAEWRLVYRKSTKKKKKNGVWGVHEGLNASSLDK